MAERIDFPDLNDPAELLIAQVRLRGSLDDKLVLWWLQATQYAVVDTVLTPLYRLLNTSFQRFTRLSDERFGITMLELAYFTDLATGETLDEFTNPFTKRSGKVPPAVFGPNQVSLTLNGLHPPENFPFGTLTFDGQLGPGYTDGEFVWIREDTLVRMTSDNPAFGNYVYNELVTYRGCIDDLSRSGPVSAPATMTYNTTSNWRPWMMAGDMPGHILSEGFGRKVSRIDDLPAEWLAIARERHPEVLENPERFMQPQPAG